MGNQNQNQAYQPRQQNYKNNQGCQGYQQGWRQDGGNSNRQNLYQNTAQTSQPQSGSSKMEETLTQFMKILMANQKRNEAKIKNIENQVGQLAKKLSEQQTGSSFFINTQTNLKEHYKAIVTRMEEILVVEKKMQRRMMRLLTLKSKGIAEDLVERQEGG